MLPDDRPWLQTYPAALPARFTPAHGHMLDYWGAAVATAADAEAMRYFDATLTYGEVDMLARGLAGWLARRGVASGDRVAIVLQNTPHFAVAAVATWMLGAIVVPCNPMYRAAELKELFADFRPAAIICEVGREAELEPLLSTLDLGATTILTADPHDFATALDSRVLPERHVLPATMLDACRSGDPLAFTMPARSAADLALILYTSGTTGKPKGAMLRHESLCFSSALAAIWMRIGANARLLGLAPYFHITGFVLHMGLAIVARASVGLTYRFHPEATLEFQRSYRATSTIAAVTAFNALAATPGVSREDFTSFDTVFSGGAPIAPALREHLRDTLGIELTPVYGMTETCSPTHIAPPGLSVPVEPETGALAVGLPISSTDMRIVDAAGVVLGEGQPAEVWIRGPQVMAGYWQREEETAAALVDGWLRTGDVGVTDASGWLYVVDRQKDMINASGFKVWPRQVEDVLMEHPAVREAAVVGEPDAYRGETVAAYVTLDGVHPADAAVLTAHCRERLAAYKVPRRIIVLDALPKTPTGKIRRAALRTVAGVTG